MIKEQLKLYQSLAKADARLIDELQHQFEDLLTVKVEKELFTALYINARYFPAFNTLPGREWKDIFLASKGNLPKASNFLYKKFSPLNVDPNFGSEQCHKIVEELNDKGYCVIENFLSGGQVDRIREDLNSFIYTPCGNRAESHRVNDLREDAKKRSADDSFYGKYTTNFLGADIQPESEVGQLLINSFMADIASKYFECQAYLTTARGFFTAAKEVNNYSDLEMSTSGRLWHFDYSELRFIKFFIYLTDVAPENGPHKFIASTEDEKLVYPNRIEDFHKAGFRIYENGEMEGLPTDEWVNRTFDQDRIKEFNAPRGTLIIENTSGLHRGEECSKDTREMLGFTYAVSNIGIPQRMPTIDYNPGEPYHGHLTPLLKKYRREQVEKYEAFSRKLPLSSRIKGKIKTMAGMS